MHVGIPGAQVHGFQAREAHIAFRSTVAFFGIPG